MRWCLSLLASRLFTQPFIQAQIKENIKAPRHWPLWGEFTGDQWIPRTKGQYHLMTSLYMEGSHVFIIDYVSNMCLSVASIDDSL